MNRRGLGFAPILVAGAAGGPPGLAIAAIAGIAGTLIYKFLPIGAGRKEADYLTDPSTGAQTKALQALDQIVAEYVPIKNAGQLTSDFIDQTAQHVRTVADNFASYAIQFERAGPGAIATIRELVNKLLASLDADRALAQDYNPAAVYTSTSTNVGPVPTVVTPIQLGPVPLGTADNSGLILLVIAAALLLWRR